MGKKSKIFYLTVLLVNLTCFILDLFPIKFPFFRISFAVSLILIGIQLMIRGISLKIDASVLFGIMFLMFGGLNMFSYFGDRFFSLDINLLWPYYIFSISFACLITAVMFKDKLQYRLCVLFLVAGGLTVLKVYNILNVWWFVGLLVLWIIVYLIFNNIMYKKRNKENG